MSFPEETKKRGRRKVVQADRRYFEVGKRVEEKLASGVELTKARNSVATAMGISYSSVVRYHKQFRGGKTRDGNSGAITITG